MTTNAIASKTIGLDQGLLADPSLAEKLLNMSTKILRPRIDNFTPRERTPWGGREILRRYKKMHGVDTEENIGESWEISGHYAFPNLFSIEHGGDIFNISLTTLERMFPSLLYGPKFSRMPILVKLLNSGSWKKYRHQLKMENLNNHQIHKKLSSLSAKNPTHREMLENNLSIQVHPSKNIIPNKPSKAEAWYIIDAEPGAGIYLGTKNGITKENFKSKMHDGYDLSFMLNFVEVKSGDIFSFLRERYML